MSYGMVTAFAAFIFVVAFLVPYTFDNTKITATEQATLEKIEYVGAGGFFGGSSQILHFDNGQVLKEHCTDCKIGSIYNIEQRWGGETTIGKPPHEIDVNPYATFADTVQK